VSILIFARPEFALKALRKFASTNLINYTELGLRLLVGLGFISLAPHADHRLVIKYAGIFFVISAIILIIIPRGWHPLRAIFFCLGRGRALDSHDLNRPFFVHFYRFCLTFQADS